MKTILFTAFILSLAACGDSTSKNENSASSATQTAQQKNSLIVGAPTPLPTLSESDFAALDRLEMIATARGTKIDRDLQSDGSVLASLHGQVNFFLIGKLGLNFTGLNARVILPAARGCALTLTEFSATDSRGSANFRLSGKDDSVENPNCTRFLADIFHHGGRLHFVNVPLTGFSDSFRVIPEVNVDLKPF